MPRKLASCGPFFRWCSVSDGSGVEGCVSKPFSKINGALTGFGQEPIDWRV